LINSLSEIKERFPIESYDRFKEPFFNTIKYNETLSSQYDIGPKNEYLAISNDIHSILSNCSEFTNTQKLDFCTNQRYFMKLYLKELLIKLKIV